jgi:hypothetical protein
LDLKCCFVFVLFDDVKLAPYKAGGKRIGINGEVERPLSGIGIYADTGICGGFDGSCAHTASRKPYNRYSDNRFRENGDFQKRTLYLKSGRFLVLLSP